MLTDSSITKQDGSFSSRTSGGLCTRLLFGILPMDRSCKLGEESKLMLHSYPGRSSYRISTCTHLISEARTSCT